MVHIGGIGGGISQPNAKQQVWNNQLNLSYTSFFNQQNIIGDPIVKPFTISTPNQNSNPPNYMASGDLQVSDMKSNSSGQVSASKQIGQHLLQVQQPTIKASQDPSSDLISLLRQIGIAYQLMSDF